MHAPGERALWERRYQTEGRRVTQPAASVVGALDAIDVEPSRALDVAGGPGRHAIWLARLGWTVTLVDGAPTALQWAREDAGAAGVEIETICVDLETEPLPAGPWDLVVIHHYLNRPLLASVAGVMTPGGYLVFAQPTVLNPADRPGPVHLVGIGETAILIPGLEIVSLVEDETEGRHEAMLVARKPV
ncbi:class I SAM-dependent methyltransferase [soil metagenome]